MRKKSEKKIFDLNYPYFETVSVSPSEAPDFICHINGKPALGVEITELFRNEGYARLEKIPDYGVQLLDGKAYKHKDDKKFIRVETCKIKSPDGTVDKEIQGIFSPGMTAQELVACLNSAISAKYCKVGRYLEKAPAVDLVIHDPAELFSAERQSIFRSISLFLEPEVISSPFREIFLIISKHDGSTLKLPIKLSIFLEEIFIFEKLLKKSSIYKSKKTKELLYILFYCLSKKGFGDCKTDFTKGKIAIKIGSHEYVYSKEGRYINWKPFEKIYEGKNNETINESIDDINDDLVRTGNEYLGRRKELSCFVDVFTT